MLTLINILKSKYLPIQYQIIEQNGPLVNNLHGERICDFYDWLKDESERKNKILEIEEYTLEKYLQSNSQQNDWTKIRKIFRHPVDYELFSEVQYRNWHTFYKYTDLSYSTSKPIFRRAKSFKDVHPHIVFDSNKISGTVVDHEYSPDAEYCAFTIQKEENQISYEIIVIDVETGRIYGKSLQLTKLKKIAWSKDNNGFFIYYDPEGEENRNLFYHSVDEHETDKLVAKIRHTEIHTFAFQVSNDYKYLILRDSCTLSIANIESLEEEIRFKLIFQISPRVTYEYVGNDQRFFIFLTNVGAPNHHLIEIDFNDESPGKHFDVIVPENLDGHGVLFSAFKYSAYLFLIYIENVQSSFYLYSLARYSIEYQVNIKDEQFVSTKIDKFGFFFQTQSFKTPQKIYRIDFGQLINCPLHAVSYSKIKPMLKKESKIPHLSEQNLLTQYDSFYSFDGTKVPMTVIQKYTSNPSKPCLVFAYGGYGIPMLPQFKLLFLLFIELFNGVVAIIYIRGGGELGDDWLLKPSEAETSYRDLITGIEYLKGEAYAKTIDPNKIAFYGASHGGLTGAVLLNKKPDLFRAAILLNGNMDLINDLPHKGRIWAKQYGDLSKRKDYNNIKTYAPLLHIRKPTNSEEAYPPTLIVASKNDKIVSITNSLKYLAHRREKAINNTFQKDKPTLLKVINSGGHHYETAEKAEYIDTVFTELQFLAEAMDLRFDKKYQK